MRLERPESTIPKKKAMMKTATRTTAVPERVSFLDGHVTFFSSVLTSLKNCLTTSNFDRKFNSISPPVHRSIGWQDATKTWQARRDSNPQHPDLESGALSVRATGLSQKTTPVRGP